MQNASAGTLFAALGVMAFPAFADGLGPGDYGYRHMEYHLRGTVEDVEAKSGKSCCDNMGECRATYVNLGDETVYLNGKWCPITRHAAIRFDVSLPDEMAMVCAGRLLDPLNNCPIVYCGAVPPGT